MKLSEGTYKGGFQGHLRHGQGSLLYEYVSVCQTDLKQFIEYFKVSKGWRSKQKVSLSGGGRNYLYPCHNVGLHKNSDFGFGCL